MIPQIITKFRESQSKLSLWRHRASGRQQPRLVTQKVGDSFTRHSDHDCNENYTECMPGGKQRCGKTPRWTIVISVMFKPGAISDRVFIQNLIFQYSFCFGKPEFWFSLARKYTSAHTWRRTARDITFLRNRNFATPGGYIKNLQRGMGCVLYLHHFKKRKWWTGNGCLDPVRIVPDEWLNDAWKMRLMRCFSSIPRPERMFWEKIIDLTVHDQLMCAFEIRGGLVLFLRLYIFFRVQFCWMSLPYLVFSGANAKPHGGYTVLVAFPTFEASIHLRPTIAYAWASCHIHKFFHKFLISLGGHDSPQLDPWNPRISKRSVWSKSRVRRNLNFQGSRDMGFKSTNGATEIWLNDRWRLILIMIPLLKIGPFIRCLDYNATQVIQSPLN